MAPLNLRCLLANKAAKKYAKKPIAPEELCWRRPVMFSREKGNKPARTRSSRKILVNNACAGPVISDFQARFVRFLL